MFSFLVVKLHCNFCRKGDSQITEVSEIPGHIALNKYAFPTVIQKTVKNRIPCKQDMSSRFLVKDETSCTFVNKEKDSIIRLPMPDIEKSMVM